MSSEAWDVIGPQPDRGGDRQARAFEAVTLERTDLAQQDFDGRWAARVEVPWWEGPRPQDPGTHAWGEVFDDDSIYLETLPPTGSFPRWWNPERDGMPHRLRVQVIEPPPVPEVVLGEAHTIDWERGGCVECLHPKDLSADEVRHLATDAGWGEAIMGGQSVLVPPVYEERADLWAEHQRHVEANLAFRASSHIDHGCGPECVDCTAKAEALGEVGRIRERLRDAGVEVTYPQGPLPGGEVRVVDPETGGAKGSKPARFDMIPADVLWELAEHYGKGEAKYPGDEATGQANWQRGYPWHLSVAAMERHLNAWLAGEDVDPETGTNHLIAVAWHAFTLRFFQKHGLGRDDIWTRRLAA